MAVRSLSTAQIRHPHFGQKPLLVRSEDWKYLGLPRPTHSRVEPSKSAHATVGAPDVRRHIEQEQRWGNLGLPEIVSLT